MQAIIVKDCVSASLTLSRNVSNDQRPLHKSLIGSKLPVFTKKEGHVLKGRPNVFLVEAALGSGEPANPLAWIQELLFNTTAKKEQEIQKSTRNWHASTKGTLVRKFRVPNSKEGQRLLQEVAGMLSEDDLFRDAKTHKGCRIQRESAHGQSVCCNNVRGLFDELPTPHLELEITVFPSGPLTAAEYQKAAKLEGILKKGRSI